MKQEKIGEKKEKREKNKQNSLIFLESLIVFIKKLAYHSLFRYKTLNRETLFVIYLQV